MNFPNFLKVAVVPKPTIFQVKAVYGSEVKVIGGMERGLLETFAEVMKFQYQVVVPGDGQWGTLSANGTWTGVIGMVNRSEADIALGKISITEQRSTAVSYSYPYDIEDLTFGTAAPYPLPKIVAFVFPFHYRVWITLFGLLILMPIIYKLLLQRKYHFHGVALKIYGILLHQPLLLKTDTDTDKIMIGTWSLGAMFISFSYSALLLSFMTIPLIMNNLETIPELVEAIEKREYRPVTFRGASYSNTLTNSKQASLKLIGELVMKNDWLIEAESTVIRSVLKKGKTAIIAPRSFLIKETPAIFVSNDKFYSLTRAVVLNKNFCCKPQLDTFIQRLSAAGIYQKLVNEQMFLDKLPGNVAQVYEDPSETSLKLEDVYGPFVLLVLGHALGMAIFFFEVIHNKIYIGKTSKFSFKKPRPNVHIESIIRVSPFLRKPLKNKVLLTNNKGSKSKFIESHKRLL